MNEEYVRHLYFRLFALQQRVAALKSRRDFDSEQSVHVHAARLDEVQDQVSMQEENIRLYFRAYNEE